MEYIKDQLLEVIGSIKETEKASGREPGSVKLIAVSKTFSADAIQTAYNAGQRLFGENKVQELESKTSGLPGDIEWHLIGHLQGNKALKAIEHASFIHSVDSVKLLSRIDRLAGENSKRPEILLEINVSGEDSKFGAAQEKEIMLLAGEAAKCENISFKGLMTMAPFDAEEKELRNVFAGLRSLRDKMEKEFSVKLPELSMGMSGDYKIAIEEGATYVRIGTAIFGKRDYTL